MSEVDKVSIVSHNFRELMRKVEEKHKEGYVIVVDNGTKNTGMRFFVTMVSTQASHSDKVATKEDSSESTTNQVETSSTDTVEAPTSNDLQDGGTVVPETPKEAVEEQPETSKDVVIDKAQPEPSKDVVKTAVAKQAPQRQQTTIKRTPK